MDATHARDSMRSYFAHVEDPRRPHPPTFHALEASLLITLLGTLCGAHNWGESEQWGQAHQAGLSALLALPHGIPSPDTVGRVFALRDPQSLPPAFVAWMNALVACCPESIALDGQARRRSLDRADGQGPMHVVSAWASHQELGLAPFKVEAKSNEITARPARWALLNLDGNGVTIDALGGQGERARQIIDQGGAYGLSVKENQPNLSADGGESLAWLKGPHPLDAEGVLGTDVQGDGGHGRVEPRQVWGTTALEGGVSGERWPG